MFGRHDVCLADMALFWWTWRFFGGRRMWLLEGVMAVALAWQTCHLFGGHGACLVDVGLFSQKWLMFGRRGACLVNVAPVWRM
jgi:hypothetical protein